MIKMYQIFVDGAMGWNTSKLDDFVDDIIDAYRLEHGRNIPQGELINIMTCLKNMDVGDNVEFRDIKLKFYCFEENEEEFIGKEMINGI